MNFYWILVVIGAIMWGVDGVLFTPRYFAYGLYNVILITFLVHLVPSIWMSLTSPGQYKALNKKNKSDIFYLFLIALFGGTIGTIFIVKALELSEFNPFSLVILIQKSQPIFAIISAMIILREKPNKYFKYYFLICLIAIYVMTFGFNSPFSLEIKSLYACLFSLISAISFGVSTTFGRRVSLKVKPQTATFYRYIFTTCITFVLLLFNVQSTIDGLIVTFNNKNIILLTLLIAVWGMIALRIYYKGLTKTNAIYATICELSFPITSVLLDFYINKSVIDPIKLGAATVLVLVIMIMNLSNYKK